MIIAKYDVASMSFSWVTRELKSATPYPIAMKVLSSTIAVFIYMDGQATH